MIVYVETNFVLEIAFAQEQQGSCHDILSLAESRVIELAIPAFSVMESYETQTRRGRQRKELCSNPEQELGQLSRSEQYSQIVGRGSEVSSLLRQSTEEDKRRLDKALSRLLECAIAVPVEVEVLKSAIEIQDRHDLGTQDSIVLASVLSHSSTASPEPECFLNRNSLDFATPDIRAQLTLYGCRLISNFSDGLNFIESSLH